MNLYTYCYDNPVFWIDPTGHSGEEYTLTIYSDQKGGHAFVAITNKTDKDITVGVYTLEAGKSVTLGTYGNKIGHNGLFYDLEAYANLYYSSDFSTYVSLSTELGKSDLTTINKFISKNDNWGFYNNCSYFASGLWNSVSDTKLSAKNGLKWNTPTALAKSIIKQGGYEVGKEVPSATQAGFKYKGKFEYSKIYQADSSVSSGRGISGSSSSSSSSSGSGSSGSSSWSKSSNSSSFPKIKN